MIRRVRFDELGGLALILRLFHTAAALIQGFALIAPVILIFVDFFPRQARDRLRDWSFSLQPQAQGLHDFIGDGFFGGVGQTEEERMRLL